MPMKNSLARRGVAAIAFAVVCVSTCPAAGAANEKVDDREPVVVILARNVLEHRLPPFMPLGNGRFVHSRDVSLACTGAGLTADRTLLYFPNSNTCERVSDQDLIPLRGRLQRLTGQWQAVDPLTRAQNEMFVAITPMPRSPNQVLVMCGCSVDQPPEGMSLCPSQTRTAGTAIGAVKFSATDADTPTLSNKFTYQRDTAAIEDGSPQGITPACTTGSGTLQCTLSGTAPAPAGTIHLTLDVSDGTFTLPLESRLQVLAVGDRIFVGGFDTAGCP